MPQACDVLRERDVNRQRASEDLSKESIMENVELGLAATHETGRDEVR